MLANIRLHKKNARISLVATQREAARAPLIRSLGPRLMPPLNPPQKRRSAFGALLALCRADIPEQAKPRRTRVLICFRSYILTPYICVIAPLLSPTITGLRTTHFRHLAIMAPCSRGIGVTPTAFVLPSAANSTTITSSATAASTSAASLASAVWTSSSAATAGSTSGAAVAAAARGVRARATRR